MTYQEAEQLYGFQCPKCFIRSGDAILSTLSEAYDYAPSCCGGEYMMPVLISKQLQASKDKVEQ